MHDVTSLRMGLLTSLIVRESWVILHLQCIVNLNNETQVCAQQYASSAPDSIETVNLTPPHEDSSQSV